MHRAGRFHTRDRKDIWGRERAVRGGVEQGSASLPGGEWPARAQEQPGEIDVQHCNGEARGDTPLPHLWRDWSGSPASRIAGPVPLGRRRKRLAVASGSGGR